MNLSKLTDKALPVLDEARRRFLAVKGDGSGPAMRMAASALTDMADSWVQMGHLDLAADSYSQVIALADDAKDRRAAAVNNGQLGSVRLRQRRLPEALEAYRDARDRFAALGEDAGVAKAWHQIGLVYRHQKAGADAESAYLQSLQITVRLNDAAGQANTLTGLGNLYAHLYNRLDVACDFYARAVDLKVQLQDCAGEGVARCNFAGAIQRLGKLPEARAEIKRAIGCLKGLGHGVEPWKAWALLSQIEHDDENPVEAHLAHVQARDTFLAYRRSGAEGLGPASQLTAQLGRLVLAGNVASAHGLLDFLASTPTPVAGLPSFLAALRAVVDGQRSPRIADASELRYDAAAEILLLLDMISKMGR